VANIKPKSYHSSSFFMPEELRNSLLMKNELSHGIEPDSSNLPLEVDNYHSLSLLEASSNHLPVPSTTCYKATHGQTGMKYCLRRYHGKDRVLRPQEVD
jgi:PAB-dependent poly(A)-specific ribonuclease subunit 3